MVLDEIQNIQGGPKLDSLTKCVKPQITNESKKKPQKTKKQNPKKKTRASEH